MNKTTPLFIISICIFCFACGGVVERTETDNKTETEKKSTESKSDFSLNIDGKDYDFETKTNLAKHWEKAFTYPVDGKNVTEKSSNTTIYLANFDPNTELDENTIDTADQIKIEIAFNGEKGTDYESPVKVGEYTIKPGDYMNVGNSFNKVDSVDIYYFADKAEKEISLLSNKMDGTLNITSVENNTITGNIDITDGKSTVKGTFTAKGDNSVK